MGTLSRLAEELNISVSDLVSDDPEIRLWQHDTVKDIETGLCKVSSGYRIFPFASHLAHKKIQPFFYEVRKDEIQPHQNSHAGEEFFYIIEGELKFILNGEEHLLHPGEGIYFDSSFEHRSIPVTDVVKVLDIII